MNERDGTPFELPRPTGSGGSMLRQLREERGLALEGLAAMLKVTPAKLDALESGRYHELPDAAFTRALAMTICRLLKVDAAPVLASLPQAQLASLAASEPNHVPFKAGRARLNLDVPAALPWREFLSARWLLPIGVLLAAVALYFLPQEWMTWRPNLDEAAVAALSASAPSSSPTAGHPPITGLASTLTPPAGSDQATSAGAVSSAASGAASAAEPVAAPAASPYEFVDSARPAASAANEAAAVNGSALVIKVTASSWIEVRDASGSRLLSRHVTPGETVGVDGTAPLALKIGNVSGVSLTYKGQGVDLQPFARNNVARLELK